MTDPHRIKLLVGPYRAPPLKPGERAFCLFRDCDALVTSWTGARIPWPRCRPLRDYRGGGWGLLLDDELARAVRHESAAAICYWWGLSEGVVWRWRKALGVGRTDSEGSRRLIRAAAEAGGRAIHERGLTPEQVEGRRRAARELDLARYLPKGYHGPCWTRAQLRLLGKEPDEVVTGKVGRTPNAVRVMRTRLGIHKAAAPA